MEVIEGEDSLYPTAVGLAEPDSAEEDEQENSGAAAMRHYEIDYAKVKISQNESVSDFNLQEVRIKDFDKYF